MKALPTLLLLFAAATAHGAALQQSSVLLRVGPQPSAIAAADLNGDDIPDIVTTDRGTLVEAREERPANDELSVLMSEGTLKYTRRNPSLKTGFGPYAVALANIDALKLPDIVVACFHDARNRDLALFLNIRHEDLFEPYYFEVPDTTLSYYRQLDADDAPMYTAPGLTSLAVHDFNNDRLRDVVATGWSSDVLVYFPGDAEKSFGTPRFIECPGAPRAVAVGDYDGDGAADLAVLLYATGEVALYRGDGGGQFAPQGKFLTRGRLPTAILTDDFNGDGKADLAVSHASTDDSVVLFYGDGGWAFGLSQEILLGEDREVLEQEVRGIASGDFDGNGARDVAAACAASGEVSVMLNNGSGRFTRERYPYTNASPRALTTADFNQDGRDDLAVALWGENAVALLLSK